MKLCASRDDVGEEITAGKREVLNDEIEGVAGILDVRDGDASDLLRTNISFNLQNWRISMHLINQRRQDDLPDITSKSLLERDATLAIKQQILRQPCPILPEPLVQLIVTHSFEPIANGVEEVVEMHLMHVVIEFYDQIL
jgi:hypothetical protein